MNTVLEIKVDNMLVKVKEFQDFGGTNKFFATGYDGNLYALKNYTQPENGYRVLSKNFTDKTTPPPDQFGIIRYNRRIDNDEK